MLYFDKREETALSAREQTSVMSLERIIHRRLFIEVDNTFSVRAIVHEFKTETDGVFTRRNTLVRFEKRLIKTLCV